jgi:hypothetical protein
MRMKDHGPPQTEQELLDFAKAYLSEAFPNPERIGCPREHVLQSAAIQPMQSDPSIHEHIACCSPCFKKYADQLARTKTEIREYQRVRRGLWVRRSAIALAIATVFVVAVYVFINKRRTEMIVTPGTSPRVTVSGNSARTIAEVPVVVDLSSLSPTRGSAQSASHSPRQILPAVPKMDLTLRLPLGSDEQLYSVTLRSKRHLVWSETARARRHDGDTLLQVRADFSHVPAGNYDLQVASADKHLVVPVSIHHTLPENAEPKP